MRIVYFGSFQHYSALILESLIASPDIEVVGVVTTSPMPVGRKQIITKTPVHLLAESHHLPIYTPNTLSASPANDARSRTPLAGVEDVDLRDVMNDSPHYFITAGYGKILPEKWLNYPSKGSLNLHFSLLPAYRGANPAEWAIMCGETKTGISLITMSDKLDGGDIIAQSEIPIDPTDTRETLYEKLYTLGAEKLPEWILNRGNWKLEIQSHSPTPYAALLKRDDGFLPWTTITKALQGQTLKVDDFPSKHLQRALMYHLSSDGLQSEHAQPDAFRQPSMRDWKPSIETFIYNLPRALATYPSLWTIVSTTRGDKRMKILSFIQTSRKSQVANLSLGIVQLEGGQPALFNQIKNLIK